MKFNLNIIIFAPILFAQFAFAESENQHTANTVGGKFEISISKTKTKPFELILNEKVVHEGDYEYFKVENSYNDGLSSYVVTYGYVPIGASRCRKEILLFDIGKYGFDKHYINHHGGVRCWDGPISSSYENNILKIKVDDEVFVYKDDRYGNKAIEKETK